MENENDRPEAPPQHIGEDGLAHPTGNSVPMVGLGGSAGSLDPLRKFLSNVPTDSGAAYVIVVHLSPEHESTLPEILQKETSMPVLGVSENVEIEKNHVYVISPGKRLSITDGTLQSMDLEKPKGRHVTIDMFFRALAEAHGVNSCAIVLSGGDGDGAIGLKRIKERGGLTIAQDPSEAEVDGIPRSAIATGMVDWIMPAAEMPARLLEYWANGRKLILPPEDVPPELPSSSEKDDEMNEASLKGILSYLKARSGHDFSDYKRATILRRVGRRMQVNGSESLPEYLSYLRVHPGETGALLQDLLISVTNFFRDKEAFIALESFIPQLFKGKSASDQIRVWVPACATGEEAYSIAILLCEYAEKLTHPPAIQVFATDLDQVAIETARDGRYQQTIHEDLGEERMRRFFNMEGGGYRVKRLIRESVLFAMHDLLKDSPFSRLDLVSCRNLLIYLNREAQNKVFDIFHFALRPAGKLFLGSSESVEEAPGLFETIDKKHRIYSRLESKRIGLPVPSGRPSHAFGFGGHGATVPSMLSRLPPDDESGTLPPPPSIGPTDLHLNLIERVSAPSIVITRNHDVVHLSKTAGKYLRMAGGEPSTNLLKLVHPDLRTALRSLLYQAPAANAPVKSRNLPLQNGTGAATVTLTVEPMEADSRAFFLVIFEEQDAPESPGAPTRVLSEEEQSLVSHLEEELDQLRSSWRHTVEQYEASVEELKASNEELHAMNEELRSATEEMETGREELQSINEEVITINLELKGKVEELGRANSDLHNLMAATRIATIFLDGDLRIKRFTPTSTGLFNFIPADEGRPLSDLTHNLEYPEITADATRVLRDLAHLEREMQSTEGRWFLIRMSPYRTTEDSIAGVVITCIDITERKKSESNLRWLSAIVESSTDAIISFTMDGNIVSWNNGAERVFGYTEGEITGKPHAVLAPPSMQGDYRELFMKLRQGETIGAFETIGQRKDGGSIDISLSASVMRDENGNIVGATMIAQDITVRKRAVKDLKQARDDLEERVRDRTAELRTRVEEIARMASEVTSVEERERKRLATSLHDELQQLLVSAKMGIQSLDTMDEEARHRETKNLSRLMDELIANSRSLAVDLSPPVLSETLGRALEWLCHTWMPEKHNLKVETRIDLPLDTVRDEMRSLIFHSVKELLFNVVKHSEVCEAKVHLAPYGENELRVTVRDHGLGFDPESGEITRASGFGLVSLRERLEMLGARFEIRSRPGDGVEAVITAPRKINPAGTDA